MSSKNYYELILTTEAICVYYKMGYTVDVFSSNNKYTIFSFIKDEYNQEYMQIDTEVYQQFIKMQAFETFAELIADNNNLYNVSVDDLINLSLKSVSTE